MRQVKAIAVLILIAAVVTFAVQNAAVVEIQFLTWSFSTPRALLVAALLAIGLALGFIISSTFVLKRQA